MPRDPGGPKYKLPASIDRLSDNNTWVQQGTRSGGRCRGEGLCSKFTFIAKNRGAVLFERVSCLSSTCSERQRVSHRSARARQKTVPGSRLDGQGMQTAMRSCNGICIMLRQTTASTKAIGAVNSKRAAEPHDHSLVNCRHTETLVVCRRPYATAAKYFRRQF